jgi:hypothetical protein
MHCFFHIQRCRRSLALPQFRSGCASPEHKHPDTAIAWLPLAVRQWSRHARIPACSVLSDYRVLFGCGVADGIGVSRPGITGSSAAVTRDVVRERSESRGCSQPAASIYMSANAPAPVSQSGTEAICKCEISIRTVPHQCRGSSRTCRRSSEQDFEHRMGFALAAHPIENAFGRPFLECYRVQLRVAD